jgi:hypothetical protein
VALAVLWLAAPGAAAVPSNAAAVPLPDVAVLPRDEPQVSLMVNVGGGAQPVRANAVSVTVDGALQPTAVEPVMSGDLAVGLVVDASADSRDQLAAWSSGAARFVLEAPSTTRTALVADRTPPVVLAKLQQNPANVVRMLSGMQPRGKRQTSQALTAAAQQLPATPTGPRLVVLYTGAPDAGGEKATELAARLAKAHILLVVVSTAAQTEYWTTAARATGGFLAPAASATIGPALDQVATMLRARYLVSFPPPAHRPAHASVRVDMDTVAMTADVVIPAANSTSAHSGQA